MITAIQLLRSVGRFDYVPAGALTLDRYVLIYAENGRGKTTLTAILRSLASGDPLPIRERRRLAALNPPHVVLQCSTGQTPAVFENGVWNRTFPDIVIFDDRFVDENVYSGLSVEPGHRQNLHELVIGAQGVVLNRRLQTFVQQIEEHITNLRMRAAAIPAAIRETFSVDEFCSLPALAEIDRQIQGTERDLAAAQQQDAVRDTPGFDMLVLPDLDAASVALTLQLDLPGLDAAAAARVQGHFGDLGQDGEQWVGDGMQRIVHTADGADICPFCTQDLALSAVIGSYREYFGQAYTDLKERVSEGLTEVRNLHPRELPGRFERGVRVATERRQFWSNFCDVPEIALETEQLMRDWQTSRDGVMAALEAKQAAPLEHIEIQEPVNLAIESFRAGRRSVGALNEQLQNSNNVIGTVKLRAAAGDSEGIASTLARLRATRTRHTAEVSALCEDYLAAKAAKEATEALRDQTRDELERFRATEFPTYRDAINAYLTLFNTGYSVGDVTPVDTRGGPTCNYEILINNVPVPISGAIPEPGEPSFRSTLSSGDRRALALAFFLSSVNRDQALATKVLVIDDPISSFDEHRSLTTVQELRRMGERVSQVIILSHDKGFLSRVWLGLNREHCSTIKLEREGDASNIVMWDVHTDSITEHDRNHSLLRSYLQNGPNGNSREVATALRPVLEAFLRVAYTEHFPPDPGAMRLFRNRCRQNLGTEIEVLSAADAIELDNLVEYANLFHHNTNQGWEQVVINDGELRGFVRRVLQFTTR